MSPRSPNDDDAGASSDPEGRPQPSLHGLEAGMANLNHEGGANFNDYLQAQKALQHRVGFDGHGGGSPSRPSAEATPQTDAAAAEAPPTPNERRVRITDDERRAMQRLSLIGRRTSVAKRGRRQSASEANDEQWQHIFEELEAIDMDGHFHDDEVHTIPWYAPPVQRQRWGADQSLPHVNWGDLFFDLFYVAAAYNLGGMLISALTPQDWPRGLIYYVGIFGPLYNTWETATYYESRYTKVDYAHRLFDIIRYMFVSTAVLHIKPLDLLSDPRSLEALIFVSAILLESIMHLGLNLELYYKGRGDRAAIRNHTWTKIKFQLLPTIAMYTAATIVATVQFAHVPADEMSDYNNYRYLAEGAYETSGPRWTLTDLPLTLTALAYLLSIFHTTWRKMRATSGKHGDIRTRFVPNNVDYIIHRFGEWIMLMVGESILSLLIVETTESRNYYIITTFGVLTVILLHILKVESDPSHAEDHALWGNLRNAMSYGYLLQILSMSLIAFGICFKIFLKDVVKEEQKEDAVDDYGYNEKDEKRGRMLAPAGSTSDEAAAALFTAALSSVLVSLELMLLTHNGIKKAIRRLYHEQPDTNDHENVQSIRRDKLNTPIVIIAIVKFSTILFAITLNQWTSEPAILTICGFSIVFIMALTRVLGWAFIHHKKSITEAAKTVTRTLTKTVSFGGVGLSASGENALADKSQQSEARKFFSKPSDLGSESEAASVSTKGTDAISSGIDDSFDAIIVSDLRGNIKQVNATALDVFRYDSKDELLGKNLSILVGGGEGKNHDAYMRRFRKNGSNTSKILGRQRMLHASRADGTEFPCLIGIRTCAGGTRIVGYIRDMSGIVSDASTKMTLDMKVEEAIDRVVDDHAFDGIVVSDDRGIIHKVNETAVTEFGYENKEEMIGLDVADLIHVVKDHPERLLESHGDQHLVTLTNKDGKDFDSIIASTKVKGADGMVATYVRNIAPIKRKLSHLSDLHV